MRSEMMKRVLVWTEHLKEDILTPVLTVPLHRMTTYDDLGFARVHELLREQQASPHWSDRAQVDEGESGVFYADYPAPWGRKWEYGWFFGEIDLAAHPEAALTGQRLELLPDVGGEMLVEVNGVLRGARDLQHETIPLTPRAQGDETFSILIESYAGHGPRLEKAGPLLYGREAVPEPPLHQVQTGLCQVCTRDEDAYGLYLDLLVLTSLYRSLEPRSLRAEQVLEAMFQATRIMDMECPRAARDRSYRAARQVLQPALDAANGTVEATFSVFGQSHLDLAWKWAEDETRRKCARTYANQLSLLDEYPDYLFFGCSPYILETLERSYPDLYARVQAQIDQGRIVVDGGMYTEPDVQMPDGECLIRQIQYAQAWSQRHRGRPMELLWLPDTFGFSGQLPQIMTQCGLRYFSSQKLSRAPEGTEPFPYNDFLWEGIDGTRVQAHFFKKSNAVATPETFRERWYRDRAQDEHIAEMLFPFGFGDGGGGATRDMVEAVARLGDLQGIPACRYEDPVSFCRRLAQRTAQKLAQGQAEDVNVYRGELYLSWHRGVWTGQSEIKRRNRQAEQALREAELWAAVAVYLGRMDPQATNADLDRLWKRLLFLQFHDVLPGTGIERVHEEARAALLEIRQGAEALSHQAKDRLLPGGRALWNPFSFPRRLNSTGAILPPCGYCPVGALPQGDPTGLSCRAEGDDTILENGTLTARIDRRGRILSLRMDGREVLQGPANELRLYRNLNTEYDAWELTSYYRGDACEDAQTDPVRTGFGVRQNGLCWEAYATFTSVIGSSPVCETLTLSEHGAEIAVELQVDWRETHKLLQAVFPTVVHTDRIIAETQYGYVTRPNHRSKPSDRDRYEGCMHRYCALFGDNLGVLLLNDGLYGCGAEGGTMTLSLLRAAKWPDGHADLGQRRFRYALRPCRGGFGQAGAAAAGYAFNAPVTLPEGDDDGPRQALSWFEIEPPDGGSGILIDWVKPADDGSGDLILRVYESMNAFETAVLRSPLPARTVYRCDALEKRLPGEPDGTMETGFSLSLRPFEFQTVRFVRP